MPKASMSGVSVPEEIQTAIQELVKKKHQYAVFEFVVLADKKTVEWTTRKVGERFEGCKGHGTITEEELREHYAEFVAEYMSPESALFVLFDFSVVRIPDVKMNIIGIQWCPDTLDVKRRMGYASSVEVMKKEAGSSTKMIIQNELCEITFDAILEKVKS